MIKDIGASMNTLAYNVVREKTCFFKRSRRNVNGVSSGFKALILGCPS